MSRFASSNALLAAAILLLAIGAAAFACVADSYTLFVLALVGLTTVVGVGLNVLLGLVGQISLGHVGFYAIGAYASGILTLHGVGFWLALPLAGVSAGAVGALLAVPALRVTGPYLAMLTIAFAFIVEHATIEWKSLTGGANGLMGIVPPSLGDLAFSEREMALLAVALAAGALLFFLALRSSGLGRAMLAVRASEPAAQSLGFRPVVVKTLAFAISAALTGIAGAVFAPLMSFISPGSFPFSQSILFLLAVVVGGAGSVLGPLLGAVVVVGLPEVLSSLAEYRLLIFAGLLLAVLWLAPEGIVGAVAGRVRRLDDRPASKTGVDLAPLLRPRERVALEVSGLGITFGGVKAASGVGFVARPGDVTSIIGPNGAGKTTVLNMIGGFYRPDAGSIRLRSELARWPAWRIARAGIARTYQTTQLFGTLSALDNVRVGFCRGRWARSERGIADASRVAEELLAFVGYRGSLAARAGDLAHVDRRLVEIARALAMGPRVLLLDEPAAGLMASDKDALSRLLKSIAALGIAVILVEHDMALVMGISDRILVLDAGRPIAEGKPAEVRRDPRVIAAYLGGAEMKARPRPADWTASTDAVLCVIRLTAGYGAAPVLEDVSLEVRPGETVAILGSNGAGKSTAMRAISGLLRPVSGGIVLAGREVASLEAHRIARSGLALVPEGRQVFPELSVLDNLRLGAFSRDDHRDVNREVEAMLVRFPRLRDRLASRAGLLSGGEQQMLAVARGLMAKPRILLLDEPSLGLAPAIVGELFGILAELRDEGVTVLLVDQMAAMALTIADRGYVLEAGRLVASGDAAILAHDGALEAAYLGGAPQAAE